jgi:hypothetical protein
VELYHYVSIRLHGVHGDLTFLTLEHDMAFMSVLSLAVGPNPDSHVGVEWCSIQNNAIDRSVDGIQCDRWRDT